MTSVAHRRVALALAAVAVALVAAAPAAGRSGTVTVPLDRTDPAAGTTRVAYRLIPRRDRSSPAQATILFNPGGPGQAPIGLAAVVRRELAPRPAGLRGPVAGEHIAPPRREPRADADLTRYRRSGRPGRRSPVSIADHPLTSSSRIPCSPRSLIPAPSPSARAPRWSSTRSSFSSPPVRAS